MSKTKEIPKSDGIFITNGGGITPSGFLILLGSPLILSGRFLWGFGLVALGLVSAVRASMEVIKESDKQAIRANILDPEDLVAELEDLEDENLEIDEVLRREQCIACLGALAKKYNKPDKPKNMALLCQQSAYLTLRLYPDDDDVIEGAIALLALVAKDNQVRRRIKNQPDVYGLDHPIKVLRNALERAKQEEDADKEEQMAEIQRKAALFLGSVTDEDKELGLPFKVVEEDGLEHILDVANWFRLHEDVANWCLWAVFILCYDRVRNKLQLVRLAGITTVCQLLKNNPRSLEVNRHGVAILFDLLREGNNEEGIKFDPWEVRRLALTAGLHAVILNAMAEFSDSMDIMMMGQELLIGTGYRGDIPQFQQM